MKPKYGRSRYPKQCRNEEGNRVCRGCQGPIPKGRISWCSSKCYFTYEPACVRHQVRLRDKGVCQICFCKTRDHDNYRPWHVDANVRKLIPKAEYDHIIPFSEGGLTTVENMRTLCSPCHKTRTATWRKEKANARKPENLTPNLL